MRRQIFIVLAVSLAWTFFPLSTTAQTEGSQTPVDARSESASYSRDLGNRDPRVRQQAAEALARLTAVDQQRVIEGYYLQEKNKNVRLALDWALYRIGRSASLFQIVRELDSGRQQQAIGYLAQLDSPAQLYPFLDRERTRPRILVGLLEALGRFGDAESLERIKPFLTRFEPGVADAAEIATEKIERRLAQVEGENPAPRRPRTVGKADQTRP